MTKKNRKRRRIQVTQTHENENSEESSSDTSLSLAAPISEVLSEANKTLGLFHETFNAMEANLNMEHDSNNITGDIPPPEAPGWLSELLQSVNYIKIKVQKLNHIEASIDAISKRLDGVETPVSNIDKRVSEIEEGCSFINNQYEEQKKCIGVLNTKQDNLRKEIQATKDNNNLLRTEVKQLNKKTSHSQMRTNYHCLDLEARSRRQNLLFHGLDEEQDENCCDKVVTFMEDALGMTGNVQINRAHRLGRFRAEKRGRSLYRSSTTYKKKK
jgi:hypothetical protein